MLKVISEKRIPRKDPIDYITTAKNNPIPQTIIRERDPFRIASFAVSRLPIVTTAIGRKAREDDWKIASQKEKLDAFRYASMAATLERQHARERERARARQSAKASAADRRFYNPEGFASAKTYSGTNARLKTGTKYAQRFINSSSVIPCIQRIVRRQVLFATKRGGKGHRVPHRHTPWSFIEC